jgi:quercetin dioxygenase-like cupin family protein
MIKTPAFFFKENAIKKQIMKLINTQSILRTFLSALLLIILTNSLLAQGHPAKSTDNEKITSITILKQLLNEPGIKNKEAQMEVVNFPPGSTSAPHRHPCPTFGYVLEGEIESVFEGTRHVYKKGDSFYEKPFGLHSVTRNNDPKKPAKLLVLFLNKM